MNKKGITKNPADPQKRRSAPPFRSADLNVRRNDNIKFLRHSVMKIDIDELTENELIDLNHRIVERLKFLESMRAHAEMLEFSIGEKVCFRSNSRETVIGILTKYNRKTVTVLTDDGRKWNVSPHLLEKVKESGSAVKNTGNVIEIKPK